MHIILVLSLLSAALALIAWLLLRRCARLSASDTPPPGSVELAARRQTPRALPPRVAPAPPDEDDAPPALVTLDLVWTKPPPTPPTPPTPHRWPVEVADLSDTESSEW